MSDLVALWEQYERRAERVVAMTEWEYKLLPLNRPDVTTLNELGIKGWEAVAIYQHTERDTYVLLKRPNSK